MLSLRVLVIQWAETNKVLQLPQESSTICILIYYVTAL
jgi:hypothetical protein